MEKYNKGNIEREGKNRTALEYMVSDVAKDVCDVSKKIGAASAMAAAYLISSPVIGMLPEKRRNELCGEDGSDIAWAVSLFTSPLAYSYAVDFMSSVSNEQALNYGLIYGLVESAIRIPAKVDGYSFGSLAGYAVDPMVEYFAKKCKPAPGKVARDMEDVGGGVI